MIIDISQNEIFLSNGEVLAKAALIDGEILALDKDGCIIQWNADEGQIYNCGETIEQFGLKNIYDREAKRLT